MQAAWTTQWQFSSTRYPLLLDRLRQYGMRSLLHTWTHDQEWESHQRPFLILSPMPLRSHATIHVSMAWRHGIYQPIWLICTHIVLPSLWMVVKYPQWGFHLVTAPQPCYAKPVTFYAPFLMSEWEITVEATSPMFILYYSSLLLLRYCWDNKKVSISRLSIIQYKFLMLCSSWDIDLVS